MAFCKFTSLPLGSQLKITLIPMVLLFLILYTIVVNYLIVWLIQDFENLQSSLLYNTEINEAQLYILKNKQYITNYLNNKVTFLKRYQNINKLVLGFSEFSPPYIPPSPLFHTVFENKPSNYSVGAFFYKNKLSDQAEAFIKKQAAIDKIFPLIKSDDYLYIYTGIEEGDIIHYFPGELTSDSSYSVYVREWYYTAKDSPNDVVITEPYFDVTTNLVVITISSAINDQNGGFYGVAACDVTLGTLTNVLSNLRILEYGFILLISNGGMVLNSPVFWSINLSEPLRITNVDVTGMSQEFLQRVLNSPDGELFEYKKNDTDYLLIKYSIFPFENERRSHYMLAFLNKTEIMSTHAKMKDELSSAYNLTLGIVIGISIVIFLLTITAISIFLFYTSNAHKMIVNSFKSMVHKALSPHIFRNLQIPELKHKKMFDWIIDTIKSKFSYLEERENEFLHFEWGITRPTDMMKFDEWVRKSYPQNYYDSLAMPWRDSIERIINK